MAIITNPSGGSKFLGDSGGFFRSRASGGSSGNNEKPTVPNMPAPGTPNNVNLGGTNNRGIVIPVPKPGGGGVGGGIKGGSGIGVGVGRHAGSGMPLDTDAQISLEQAAQARINYMDQLNMQRQQSIQSYNDQLEDLNKQHPLDQGTLNSNYGSAGLGFSSGYGNANAQLADAYSTNQSRLTQAEEDSLNNIRTNRRDYQNTYLENEAAIRQAAAERLSALAGTLGLGHPTTNPNKLFRLLEGLR